MLVHQHCLDTDSTVHTNTSGQWSFKGKTLELPQSWKEVRPRAMQESTHKDCIIKPQGTNGNPFTRPWGENRQQCQLQT